MGNIYGMADIYVSHVFSGDINRMTGQGKGESMTGGKKLEGYLYKFQSWLVLEKN
jgi:hypothetical protein